MSEQEVALELTVYRDGSFIVKAKDKIAKGRFSEAQACLAALAIILTGSIVAQYGYDKLLDELEKRFK